jgi:prepilin-type N-terminal cleavage/methylation domain-containing protein
MLRWSVTSQNKNRNIPSRGFTLIELLIAVSIFSVVSIAIYATFSSGATVLKRVKNIDLQQQMILLKTEKLSRQLRQQSACSKLLFQGQSDKISFCENIDDYPYRVTYYFNSQAKALLQVADRLDEIIEETGKLDPELHGRPMIFLSKVTDMQFSYLYLDVVKNEYLWAQEWKKSMPPVAVKFVIFRQQEKYESTVYLPRA